MSTSELIISDVTICDDCMCGLSDSKDDPAEVTIYGRQGTKFGRHYHKECPNRWCRKTFYHGYSVKGDKKVYQPLKANNYLFISQETAFTVDFCFEMTLHVLHNKATFQGCADVYNQFHNFDCKSSDRNSLNRKRLSTAFFCMAFWNSHPVLVFYMSLSLVILGWRKAF